MVNRKHRPLSIPSDGQIKHLLHLYQSENLILTKKFARAMVKKFPKHPFAFKILGAILAQEGETAEAAIAHQTAATLSPNDAEAHQNLGITLYDLGKFDRAEESFRTAVALNPNYAKAFDNLGITLTALKRFKEAEKCFYQAINLQPNSPKYYNDLGVSLGASGRLNESRAALEKALLMQPEYAEAHDNLGNTLQDLGEHAKAISEHFHAITLEPNYTTAKANLGRAVAMVRFTSSNTQLYPVLADLLKNGNLVQVKLIAKSVTSLLRNDPTLQNLVAGKQESYQTSEAMSVVKSLDKFQLLHEFLRVSPLLDLQIESLLTALRRAILLGLAEINADPELIRFLSTISLHCFVNEYIYFESAKETELITTLGLEIESAIAGGLQPDPLKVLCFSAYRLLHKQRWCESLTELSELEEINRRQVLEPLEEYTYAFNTPKLNRITDKVSKQVRAQYEENPYPRWLKVRIPRNAISVAEHCDEVGLRLLNNKIRDVTQPKILIAGCGTGQQSIGAAARYSNCQVLAIDLSLASLAYAQRKTFELKLDNLRYAQSDILTLAELGSSFDIIECSGVLHHMQDPLAGWRALVDLLKPEGLIKIGLYSELARQSISKARADIASLQIKATAAEIRAFRQQVAASSENPHRELTSFNSFYSLSEFRDLVFHVQEHQFTIPKIQDSLDELGLAFCGFEHDTKKLPKFEKFFPHNRDIYDLERWHELERSNPDTFRGMYQFWCQRY